MVFAAEVGETGGLEEADVVSEDRVDIGEDAVQVDNVRIEAEGGVQRELGGEVVRAGLDPFGLDVPHAGEGLVDFEHEVSNFVESGFLSGGERGVRGGGGGVGQWPWC